jgi:hypothetical protein
MEHISSNSKESSALVKIGGIYKHYKGNEYKVLMLSRSCDDLSWWVVYQTLYENDISQIWHRKLEDFLSIETWPGHTIPTPRFALIK